jgi:hypothetical protein
VRARLSDSVWDWMHDGRNKNGDIRFHGDGALDAFGRSTWEVTGRREVTCANIGGCGVHVLTFDEGVNSFTCSHSGQRGVHQGVCGKGFAVLQGGSIVRILSLRYNGHYLDSHQSQAALHTPLAVNEGTNVPVWCQWRVHVVEGHRGCYWLESVRYPGQYLDAHHSESVRVTACDVVPGDWGVWRVHLTGGGGEVEIESMRYPGSFLDANHDEGRVLVTRCRGIWSHWKLCDEEDSTVGVQEFAVPHAASKSVKVVRVLFATFLH